MKELTKKQIEEVREYLNVELEYSLNRVLFQDIHKSYKFAFWKLTTTIKEIFYINKDNTLYIGFIIGSYARVGEVAYISLFTKNIYERVGKVCWLLGFTWGGKK